jgi:glucose-1-phosphate thymidylyltransferase
VAIVGVIPAAGYATRLQPLSVSKEVLAIGGRPIMDYLAERMQVGGCARLRVVTRPEKEDVISHARELGAEVVLARPPSASASLAAGMEGLAEDDIVLIGFPDSIWQPPSGFQPLVRAVREHAADVALGLFRVDASHLRRSDVVVFDEDGGIAGVEIKPAEPPSEWIWGCAAARTPIWSGLGRTEWPGEYVDLLLREGRTVAGVKLSDAWLDVGTQETLQRALADPPGDAA